MCTRERDQKGERGSSKTVGAQEARNNERVHVRLCVLAELSLTERKRNGKKYDEVVSPLCLYHSSLSH